MPLPEGRVYCYLDVSSQSDEDPTQGNPDRLVELFEDFAAPSSDLIRAGTARRAPFISGPSRKSPATTGSMGGLC